eukprot:CAMPEP_0114645420 /NCGR_PEP_ID=MMETSP0191-20121206/4547_1 /TAXON_ID=126664 /ORGANISM="Sorites sp." /LENGTH=262 /DNA_ID=CAMNT_0001858059 /DNA_START=24 /DNA_END=813 /DNA_ORIENTATION=-
MTQKPEVKVFYEPETHTVCSVVKDPNSSKAAVVDSVMGFDFSSGSTNTGHADQVIDFIQKNGLEVNGSWKPMHILGPDFQKDGSQFDKLFTDGETFQLGELKASVMYTPGHTPACVCYLIGDALFTGDTLFMPDYGTARCDFPGGSSKLLYESIQKIMALPDATRVFVGHDYLPKDGRKDFAWETTIGDQRNNNIHIGGGKSQEEFCTMRDSRDAQLAVPKLIVPSVQVNIRAGRFPEPDANGHVALSLPINKISNTGSLNP